MSTTDSNTTTASSDKPFKHKVADALTASEKAVAEVTIDVGGKPVTKYYKRVNRSFAEILPAKPRATRIKRFTLCQRIEDLPHHADVEIKALRQLDASVQADIERKVEPLEEEDTSAHTSRQRKPQRERSPSDKDRFGHAADPEHDPKHLEVASAPAGTSDEHGGGW